MTSLLSGFIEGVFVEVLWDIERCNVEGRREGVRVMESLWWRGEVTEVRNDRGLTLAKIRYDPIGDFDVQVGEVRVFPSHMQVIGEKDVTQLRWRHYESSGDVTYNTDVGDRNVATGVSGMCATGADEQSLRVSALQQQLEDLACQFERLERLVHSRRNMFSRVNGVETSADQCCGRLCSLLRHKLAVVVQKPLHTFRNRNENKDANNLFDLSCAGSIRVDVDCSVGEFQMLCRLVKGRYERSCFVVDGRPFAPFSGSLRASLGVAEILFDSLPGLCEAIGICHDIDIMNIAKRERLSVKKNQLADAAIHVAGSFLIDHEVHETPSAILVSRTVHEGLQNNEQIDVLTRENQELDPRTVWYANPLRKQRMVLSTLLYHIYEKSASSSSYKERLTAIRTETSCFTLRWRPLLNPNRKVWTRSMIMQIDSAGTLEVDIPYVLIRGTRGIEEMKALIGDEYIVHHVAEDSTRSNIN